MIGLIKNEFMKLLLRKSTNLFNRSWCIMYFTLSPYKCSL